MWIRDRDYYMIAVINLDQKNYSKAREYAKKAAATNTSYGQPYILIGQMYAATVKNVFPNDGVLASCLLYTSRIPIIIEPIIPIIT